MKENYAFARRAGGRPRAATHRSASRRAGGTRRPTLASLLLLLLLSAAGAQAQQRPAPSFFREDGAARAAAAASPLAAGLRQARPLTLDAPALQATLASAPLESQRSAALELALPLPGGGSARFRIVEAPIMEPALAARFPSIKTYRGVGIDDPGATVRLDFTPLGFHAQLIGADKSRVYIEPVSTTDQQHYLSFFRHDMVPRSLANRGGCGVTAATIAALPGAQRGAGGGSGPALLATGSQLRTYRLAVAATGEYTATKGGTVALGQAGIVTTINRVNGVYETELAVRLVLVGNNSSLVYTNANTDPYTDDDPDLLLTENQDNVDMIIGPANYDVGHVFTTGGGGLAGLGVVCRAGEKALGETGLPDPSGDVFAIDFVAHELGHQFGANHTFNSGDASNCIDTATRNASTAYEVGSGSTIMAYAGICDPDNIQSNSDPYFHVASYEEIRAYLNTTSCGTTTSTGNTPPAVTSLPATRTLPIGTPFKLTAGGSDANGDAFTYSWEEYDLGPAGAPIAPQVTNQTNPLFRSFAPSTSPTRYFPRLSNLVANTSDVGERLPTVTRGLKFRVTLRDQHNGTAGVVGGINSSTVVNLSATNAAGPFLVTAPNTAVTWAGASSQTVSWNVAGTTANGVNCTTVNIRLSTDGGFTYPTVLLSGTANDGSEAVTVPNVATTQARIMVEAADNYFFDISNANFTINAVACAAPTALSVGSITSSSASVSFTASGSATSYTVTTTPATSTQTGVAGSPVSLTGLTAGTSYTVNIVSSCGGGATSAAATANFTTGAAPTVASVLTATGLTYALGATIPVTVRFSQSVTVTGAPTLALTIGGTVRPAAYSAANSSGTDVRFDYVVQAGDLDADGIAIGAISLNGGTIRNAASTNATLTLNNVPNTSTTLVDGVVPTASSSNRQSPAAALTNSASVTFRVTFGENVTGVNAADFSLTTTGSAAGTIASVSGSGSTRDVTVNNLSGDGTLRLDLNATGTGIQDAAGNPISGGFSAGQTYTLDRTAPSTTIDSGPALSATSTTATFTFSGTDGGGSGVASFEGSLDGAAFTAVSSPLTFNSLALGAHTFLVRAIDLAGNADASPASYAWTVVAAAPVVTSFNPTSGPVGTVVSISGTGFTGATSVGFNGTAATTFTVNSAGSITATVPGGATTGPIAVTTPGGTGSSAGSFTVTLADLMVSATENIPGGSYNNITITSTGTLALGGPLNVAGTLLVLDGGTFQSNCHPVSGAGSFTLAAGGTLNICSPDGISLAGAAGDIQLSGTRSFSNDASYTYLGTQAQATGPGLPATVRHLRLDNAAGVTLSTNVRIRQTLTPALGTFTTTGRVLTLLSDAGSTAIVVHTRPQHGLISGPITVQRYVDGSLNAGAGYRHFSSPVTNTTIADLTTAGFAPVVNDAYNAAPRPGLVMPFPTVFGYAQSRLTSATNNLGSFDKGWFSPDALTDPLTWGMGYTVSCPAGITPDFVGTPGQTTLTRSNLDRGPQADAGWYLLGNPYPSPIHWDSVRQHNGLSGVNNALYVFKSSGQYAGTYASYVNGIGLNGGGPVLPLGQGFFVRTTTASQSGQVTLRNTDRLPTPNAPAFQRQTAATDTRPLLCLRLAAAAGNADETVIYLQAGATAAGTDAQFDAPKLHNPGAALSLASLMSGPLSQPLAINGLPELSVANSRSQVPLLLTVPAAGTYRLQAAALTHFEPGVSVTLVDHATNTHTDLRRTPDYAFTTAQGGSMGSRFELWLSRPGSVTATTSAVATQFSVWPNPATQQAALHIALPTPATTATATLHTLLGQQLSFRSFSGEGTSLVTSSLAAGTYLLTVQAAGQAATTRRVVVE